MGNLISSTLKGIVYGSLIGIGFVFILNFPWTLFYASYLMGIKYGAVVGGVVGVLTNDAKKMDGFIREWISILGKFLFF